MGFMYKGEEIPTGGSTDITAGDGLSKDGDTIDLDNPVRGIYTQEEFNALTEEQQASGTYFVDDGSGGGAGQVYSTEEVRIGTWIDGKPLYRKVFYLTTPEATTTSQEIANVSALNIETVTKLSGLINETTGQFVPVPYYIDGAYKCYLICCTNQSNWAPGTLCCMVGSSSAKRPITLTLEYTKTTDPTPTQEVIN